MALNIQRINFEPIGGDSATAAFRKLDLGIGEVAGAIDGDGSPNSGISNRIAAAEQKLSNLGNASTKNLGAVAGTVAAGDDSRLVAVATKLDKINPVITGALKSDNGNLVLQPGANGTVFIRPNPESETGQARVSSDGMLTVSGSTNTNDVLSRSGAVTGGSGAANYLVLQSGGFQGSVILRPSYQSTAGQAALSATGNLSCVSLTQTSSADVKDYLQGYGGALGAIDKLVVLTYQYRDTYVSDGGRTRVGILAENVADAIPQAVTPAQMVTLRISDPSWDGEGEAQYIEQTSVIPASVDPMQLVSVALRGIQELVGQIGALTARVAALESPPTV